MINKLQQHILLSVTCTPLNLHIARELKIGLISVLQKHIYVTSCIVTGIVLVNQIAIRSENAWTGQV